MTKFITTGAELDLAQVPAGTMSLRINRIRKPELRRLQGLDALTITELELRWLSGPDLTAVPFPPTLQRLSVWQSRSVKSMNGIQTATGLQSVVWENNVKLEDATALGMLPHLRQLEVYGSIIAKQKMSSFDFLKDLTLDKLVLVGMEGADLDLTPVAQMRQPKELVLNERAFEQTEVAKVAAVNSAFYNDIMQPERLPLKEVQCTRCPSQIKHVRLKGVKTLLCESCDAAKIAKALADFQALVDAVQVR